jgi:hypothetical protein
VVVVVGDVVGVVDVGEAVVVVDDVVVVLGVVVDVGAAAWNSHVPRLQSAGGAAVTT